MGQLSPRVKAILARFVAAVRAEVPVDAVYVFGSAARGEEREDSDLDVVVVSPAFRTMRRVDAIALLLSKTRGLGVDLQPVGLAPEDLADLDDVVARAVAAHGVEVEAA